MTGENSTRESLEKVSLCAAPGQPRGPAIPHFPVMKNLLCLAMLLPYLAAHGAEQPLYEINFSTTPLGRLPSGWRDLGVSRSSPNWAVDGKGLLRVVWKGERGLIVYEGPLANGEPGNTFADGTISADFQKTPDEGVSFAVVGRVRDARNYYAVRFSGTNAIALVKVTDGKEESLADFVTRERYQEGQTWKLSLRFDGPRITGRVQDASGTEQVRVDALDEKGFASGAAGLQCTNYSAARNFAILSPEPFSAKRLASRSEEKKGEDFGLVVTPARDLEKINTPFHKLAASYDVIVAGAGSGGWAAAMQASRLGAKVLLVEESDWIGGQMAAAAVTSMDEEGVWDKFPVRERGLYREFHQSMINYYYTLNKDPFRAYYSWPEQIEGGYEPKIVRAVLSAFIAEARKKGTLDLITGTKISEVKKNGDTVVGVGLKKGKDARSVACKVLVEATEYGDVLPLTGARYRVGASRSDALDPESPVQYHTWLGVIREYPNGVPEHLRIKSPPPGYEPRRYQKSQLYGRLIWGAIGKEYKGPRVYRVLFAWRGMADSESPATGLPTQQRHTQCGLNGGRQDYPVTVAGIEDPAVRRIQQRDGIYRTLSEIYYFQNELGLPWAVAEDEGYNTPHNRQTMEQLDLREDLLPVAIHLPQWPYVRECRRGMGLYTLRTSDMGRFENARLFPNSVALGDYFMDIDHGKTSHAVETDLDAAEKPPRGGGPFQVPFEVFIPEKIDGLVFAEKNISQSRIVNGATRLQPVTILTGQAAGAIAALAVRDGVPPRKVNPIAVQAALLKAGSNLIQRWYEDVPWGSPLWQATQLLSLHSVMDEPGPFAKDAGKAMGAGNFWRPGEPLSEESFASAVRRLAELAGKTPPSTAAGQPLTWDVAGKSLSAIDPAWKAKAPPGGAVTRGDFAVAAAGILARTGQPVLLSDSQVAAR